MRALVLVAVGATGCGWQCGVFDYRGLDLPEQCGSVYGTQGFATVDSDGRFEDGAVELLFDHSTEPGKFELDGSTGLQSVRFRADKLERGAVLGLDDVVSECSWVERRWTTAGRVDIAHSGPFESLELVVKGKVLKADWAAEGQPWRFQWTWSCDGGAIEGDATDVVFLERLTGSPNLDELPE